MKKLMFLIFIALNLIWFSCTQKEQGFQNTSLKNPAEQIVALESDADNLVEAADYEADLFSLGEGAITASTKSAIIGGSFQDMFQNFIKIRLRYKDGIGPNVSLVTTNGGFPKTLTIDYGTGIELANGRVLSGKIIVVISGPASTAGSERSITYENFSNGYISLSGTSIKKRTNDSVNRVFTITSSLTLTFPDATTITRTEEKTMKWIAGVDTQFNPADDIIEITGSVEVKNRQGDEFTKTITIPLIKTGECRFITKGVIEFKTSTGRFATLDYGNGDCDNIAVRTTSKGSNEIILGH